MKRAIVAVARRMAVVMHRIWVDCTEFRWTRDFVAVTAILKALDPERPIREAVLTLLEGL